VTVMGESRQRHHHQANQPDDQEDEKHGWAPLRESVGLRALVRKELEIRRKRRGHGEVGQGPGTVLFVPSDALTARHDPTEN
jgi:hypothetical protein